MYNINYKLIIREGLRMKQLFETDTTMEERFGKCPYATAQSLISGKRAVLILHYLEDGPVRFNELQRRMPKMTHATLSVQLKTLIENGLVERKQYETVPLKVEYSLTPIGKEFRPVIEALQEWGQKYIEYTKKEKPPEFQNHFAACGEGISIPYHGQDFLLKFHLLFFV